MTTDSTLPPPGAKIAGDSSTITPAESLGKSPAKRKGGRPSRLVETEYLHAIMGVATLQEWRVIARKAVNQAKEGDPKARDWLSKYLLGPERAQAERQAATVTVDNGTGSATTFTFTIATPQTAAAPIDITPPPAASEEGNNDD